MFTDTLKTFLNPFHAQSVIFAALSLILRDTPIPLLVYAKKSYDYIPARTYHDLQTSIRREIAHSTIMEKIKLGKKTKHRKIRSMSKR